MAAGVPPRLAHALPADSREGGLGVLQLRRRRWWYPQAAPLAQEKRGFPVTSALRFCLIASEHYRERATGRT
jgi:hypothetical protein